MEKTKIEWADSSWNPVTGCYHQCEYCYARTMVRRFSGVKIGDGRGNLIVLDEPYVSADGKTRPYPYEFLPTFHRYRLGDYAKKKGRTIFVCSMADLFGEWVPDEWIEQVFEACAKAPQHRYLFLTKNPARYGTLAAAGKLPKEKNHWYGVTAADHQKAEANFRHIPNGWGGYSLFLSAEPLHGEINIPALNSWPKLVIMGAETGNRKGKVIPNRSWVENTARAAEEIGASVFMKDSLIPIIGEENMKRDFPWRKQA